MNKYIHSSLIKIKEKKIPNAELDLKILTKMKHLLKKDIILSNLIIKDIDLKYFNFY